MLKVTVVILGSLGFRVSVGIFFDYDQIRSNWSVRLGVCVFDVICEGGLSFFYYVYKNINISSKRWYKSLSWFASK